MDVGRVLKDSWTIFSKDWGALLVAALIAFLLGIVTFGVLGPALLAGIYLMVLRRVREGRKAEIGDVFGCFDRLGAYVLAYLLFLGIALAFAVIVGSPLLLLVIHNSGARAFGWFLFALAAIAAFFVGIYLVTVWIYWIIIMVDRRRGVIEALAESRAVVVRSGFWMTLLVIFLIWVIANAATTVLSAVTFGIGGVLGFLVLPWQIAAFTSMYLQATGEERLLPSAYPGASSLWLGGGFFAAPFQAGGYQPPYGPPGAAGSGGYAPPGSPPTPPYPQPGAAPAYPPPGSAPYYGPPPYGPPGAGPAWPPPQGAPAAWQPPAQAPPWASPPPQGAPAAWQPPAQAPPWASPPPSQAPQAPPSASPPPSQAPQAPPWASPPPSQAPQAPPWSQPAPGPGQPSPPASAGEEHAQPPAPAGEHGPKPPAPASGGPDVSTPTPPAPPQPPA